MKKLISICLGIMLFFPIHAKGFYDPGYYDWWSFVYDWTTNDSGGFYYSGRAYYPNWPSRTIITSISGNNLTVDNYAGGFADNFSGSSFYNGTTWTGLGHNEWYFLQATRIDGSNIVGYYYDIWSKVHGFTYDGTNYATLDFPNGNYTALSGIDGSNIVGQYADNNGFHGFLYDGLNWTTLDFIPSDISGSLIVGGNTIYDMTDGNETSLYINNGNTPSISGIDGNNIVGSCSGNGFLYNLSTEAYSSFGSWSINDIDGSKIACYDEYIYIPPPPPDIPEPATLLLLTLGGLFLRKK